MGVLNIYACVCLRTAATFARVSDPTFIIDCHRCKAKVAAHQKGLAEKSYCNEEHEPGGYRLYIGSCPVCDSFLVGEASQVGFEGYNDEEDVWTDVVRVFPKPSRTFSSTRIPNVVKDSLIEAERCLQANANIAACVMLGRALEAVCRNILSSASPVLPVPAAPVPAAKKRMMLAEGIEQLKLKGIIDDRLYDWSQQLHAFRNLAAHPEDVSISREDAEDLQTFVNAIVEYIYDLTDRYDDFKFRIERRNRRKRASEGTI